MTKINVLYVVVFVSYNNTIFSDMHIISDFGSTNNWALLDYNIFSNMHGQKFNVPNIIIEVEKVDAYNFGYLVYFFFKAVAMSAYLLEVNPFNQPGVEDYKRNMFALLGKKGYVDLATELKKKLK